MNNFNRWILICEIGLHSVGLKATEVQKNSGKQNSGHEGRMED
jgi:hypothetical protein